MSAYIPAICDKNMFFVLKSNGIGTAYQHVPKSSTIKNDTEFQFDQVYPTDSDEEDEDFDLETRALTSAKKFKIKDEFKIALRIFWDDNFNTEFGNNAVERFSPLDFSYLKKYVV